VNLFGGQKLGKSLRFHAELPHCVSCDGSSCYSLIAAISRKIFGIVYAPINWL